MGLNIKYKKGDFFIKLGIYLVIFLFVGFLYIIILNQFSEVSNSEATLERYIELNKQYCSNINMTYKSKVDKICTLLRCDDTIIHYCEDNNTQVKINTQDPLFCELKIKKTLGWCK